MHTSFNKYHLSTQLGRKSLRDVYIAYPVDEPEHEVVLKVFDSTCLPSNFDYEDFAEKADLIKQLNHQHIVPILDIGIEEGEPYVVSEYLPYGSLRSRLDSGSSERLDISDALNICVQLGEALSYAHHFNVIHGNIKPENILFDADGNALLTDFGLVGLIDVNKLGYKSDARAISYMAPEQFISNVSEKSDQYALACIIYELITGRVPFTARGFSLMWLKHSTDVPVAPSKIVTNLPKPIEVALLKALANDPSERHNDMTSFIGPFRSVSLPLTPLTPAFSSAQATSSTSNSELPTFALGEAVPMNRSRKSPPRSPTAELSVTASITDEEAEDAFIDSWITDEGAEDAFVEASIRDEEEGDPYIAGSMEDEEEGDPYIAGSMEDEEEGDPYIAGSMEDEEVDEPYIGEPMEDEEDEDSFVGGSMEDEEVDEPYIGESMEDEEDEDSFVGGSMEDEEDEDSFVGEPMEDEEDEDSFVGGSMEDEEVDEPYIGGSMEDEEDEDSFVGGSMEDEEVDEPYIGGSMEDEEEDDHFMGGLVGNKKPESRFLTTSVADEETENRFLDVYDDDTDVESDDFASPPGNPSFPFGTGSRSSRKTVLFKEPEDRFVAASVTDEEDDDQFVDVYDDDTDVESDDFASSPGNPSFPFGPAARSPRRKASFTSRLKQQSGQLEDDDVASPVGIAEPPLPPGQIPLQGDQVMVPDIDEPAPMAPAPNLPRQSRSKKKGPILLLVVVLVFSVGIVYTRFNQGATPTSHVASTSQPTQQSVQLPTPQLTPQPAPPLQESPTTSALATQSPVPLPATPALASPTVEATSTPTPTPTPRATRVPHVAPPVVPKPKPTPVPQTTPASQTTLNLTFHEYNRYTNLTNEGTVDWEQWGLNQATDVNRKTGVTPQISNFTPQGNGSVGSDHVNPVNFTWSDGTPLKSVYKSTGAIYMTGLNNGFSITVPASAQPRTLRLYVGLSPAKLRWHFSTLLIASSAGCARMCATGRVSWSCSAAAPDGRRQV